jgi:hypothetical protein
MLMGQFRIFTGHLAVVFDVGVEPHILQLRLRSSYQSNLSFEPLSRWITKSVH